MTQNLPAADFTSHLSIERDALRSFVTLLTAEQQALVDGDTEQLLSLSDSKTQAVHELAKLANARKEDMAKVKANGISSWLKFRAPNSESTWKDIQQLAEQVQYLNSTNGTLIQTKLRNNQQALTVLHNAANSAHGLYGADGQPHHSSSGRILGSV